MQQNDTRIEKSSAEHGSLQEIAMQLGESPDRNNKSVTTIKEETVVEESNAQVSASQSRIEDGYSLIESTVVQSMPAND